MPTGVVPVVGRALVPPVLGWSSVRAPALLVRGAPNVEPLRVLPLLEPVVGATKRVPELVVTRGVVERWGVVERLPELVFERPNKDEPLLLRLDPLLPNEDRLEPLEPREVEPRDWEAEPRDWLLELREVELRDWEAELRDWEAELRTGVDVLRELWVTRLPDRWAGSAKAAGARSIATAATRGRKK